MKHRITRKMTLGILMALVLAFNVQSVADALTFGTTRTGDFQTALPNDDFKISFSVSLKSAADIEDANGKRIKDSTSTGGDENHRIDSSGYLVQDVGTSEYREIKAGTAFSETYYYKKDNKYEATTATTTFLVNSSGYVYVPVSDKGYPVYTGGTYDDTAKTLASPKQVKAEPKKKVDDENRYHFNEEQVTITVNDANIKKVGTHDLFGTPSTWTLKETGKDGEKLSSSMTLTLTASSPAEVTITIADTTPRADLPTDYQKDGDASGSKYTLNSTYTVYVVNFDETVRAGTTAFSITDGTKVDSTTRAVARSFQTPQAIGFSLQGEPITNIPLVFKVEGGGQVYVREPERATDADKKGSSKTTLETSSAATVYLDMRGNTNKVTVYPRGKNPSTHGKSIIYIHGFAQLTVTEGSGQTGAPGGRLEEVLGVKVTDSKNRAIRYPLIVRFPATGENDGNGTGGGRFIPFPGTTLWVTNQKQEANSVSPTAAVVHEVYTDSSGIAKIYYQLASVGLTMGTSYPITPGLKHNTGVTDTFRFNTGTTGSNRVANLEILSGNPQRAEKAKNLTDPLVVIARSTAGYRIPNVVIQFRTSIGTLSRHGLTATPLLNGRDNDNIPSDNPSQLGWGEIPANTPNPNTGQQIYVVTGSDGQASVDYNVGQFVIARTVTAEIRHEPLDSNYSFAIDQVTFNINGSPPPSDTRREDPPADTSPSLTVSTTTITGRPGSTHDITIAATATAQVGNIVFGEFLNAGGTASPNSSSGTFTSRLTLPNTEGTYNLVVSMGALRRTVSVTVSSTAAEGQQTSGTLAVQIDPFSGAPGTTATVTVTATDTNNQPANVTVSLSATGGTLSSSSVATGTDGTDNTIKIVRSSTVGTENYVTVSGPSGYESVRGRFIISGAPTPGQGSQQPSAPGTPAALDAYEGNNQTGSLNTRLPDPLVVEVVDANDNPVENVRVRFRTTIGSGQFSPRTVRTDEDGFAEVRFTPTTPGRIRIVATVAGLDKTAAFNVQGGEPADALVKVSGDTQNGTPGKALAKPFIVEVQDEDGKPLSGHRVTFEVTAGGGSLSETSDVSDAKGRAETTLTLGSQRGVNSVEASVTGADPVTFNTSIAARILVAAANRPVMYWISEGALYQLAGAKEAKIAESANDVAVGSGKVYWTARTGPSAGTINSANLDGSGATTLATIQAVPMGIAVDTAGSKLYWTNSRGRIQSASLNGSGIRNVRQNLSDPTDLAIGDGHIYWTEDSNSIRRVNMTGQKVVKDVAVGLMDVGGIAVGSGKVYWTEATGASAGTINGANLDGTQFKTLATLKAAPMGISVDTAGSKLYWTNSRGRVQRANLNGSKIQNVVDGLISPSTLVIGGATQTTATKPATKPTETQQPKKDTAKYDVNGDGTVDNVDASLVTKAIETNNAKYDVNGDGTVNFLDLLLVFDNRDESAAAAPTVLGMKLTSVQIDVIQEQIDLLIATGDRSPSAMRTLIYLQQLIATARPEKTQLLANYPNPFNPETWIPYELATDTEVRITIYNTQGVVIRTLELGHQSAGYYTGRERAAYWDGRNAFGEQVASGIYFYQLETDEMSAMRKMVILK